MKRFLNTCCHKTSQMFRYSQFTHRTLNHFQRRGLPTVAQLNLPYGTPSATVSLVQRAIDYASVLNNEASTLGEVEPFWHPHIVHIEYPNLLQIYGRQRNYKDLVSQFKTAKKVLSDQSFDISNVYTTRENDYSIAMELKWVGVLAVPIREYAVGDKLEANISAFLQFDENGRITRQRNYVCYYAKEDQ